MSKWKPVPDVSVLLRPTILLCLNSVNLGTKVCLLSNALLWVSAQLFMSARGIGPGSSEVVLGQMRVSWCQRLDGRMLSTFSMMKFRGANRVLRNCRSKDGEKSPLVYFRKKTHVGQICILVYVHVSYSLGSARVTMLLRNKD